LQALLLIVAAYLIGSVPIGLIVGKIGYGKDIRQYGSGNLGATNVLRVLGVLPGILVLVLDVCKGLLATGLSSSLFPQAPSLIQHTQNLSIWHSTVIVLTAMAVICGHNWSVYLRFSWGKGVATAAGVLIMLVPVIVLILLGLWIAVVAATRYVSLASIIVAAVFPVLMLFFFPDNIPYILFSIVAALVVIYKHRSNIKRLLAGNENKLGKSISMPRENQ
jgi:glycerol-3-phosphate acyltransferase PlsY